MPSFINEDHSQGYSFQWSMNRSW